MAQALPNIAEYSVSEISLHLKRMVEDNFGYVRVRGEISGFKGRHSSGHCYFALKDDRARLEAIVWGTTLPRLRFKPAEGIEVIASGKLTTFPGQSKYQLVIEAMEPAGVGALMQLLEARRKALGDEGLFAEARKKPLPYLPRIIGVITSPTGAVIRDILHRLADRFPTQVIVWPVRVQGETSAAEVAYAIRGFNEFPAGGRHPRPDLIIVARGGGSLEDLWSFNEEIVVRAAAASAIPLISAVGHETDFTLLDMAADRRAPTPSAAAEIAVPVRSELVEGVTRQAARLSAGVLRYIETRSRDLRAAARALPSADDLLATRRRTFDDLAARIVLALSANAQLHRGQFERASARLSVSNLGSALARAAERLAAVAARGDSAIAARHNRLQARLQSAGRLLEAVSYRSVLDRGFALVATDGAPVRSAAAVPAGKVLDIEFHDGHVAAVSSGIASPRRRRRVTDDGSQGTLI
jgi:exodeoxyribonuclease VII large subunit